MSKSELNLKFKILGVKIWVGPSKIQVPIQGVIRNLGVHLKLGWGGQNLDSSGVRDRFASETHCHAS